MERFETMSELGSGAFGRVSLVRERNSGRLIALKIAHLGSQPLISARMRREYRALARLDHQNIVQVFELGESNGKPFIALEFVDGVTLEAWLQQSQTQTRILEVFIELANALEAVHGAGLLHRDLKPENVMINKTGTLKLMDFGLSKLDDSSLQLTKVGAMVGTALYMSPEQCRGDALDSRSDWYAFGIMLYRALCGQLPFTGQTLVEVIMAHLQRQAIAPRQLNPQIPVALEALILSLLAKRASDRPGGAGAIRNVLLEALEQPLDSVVAVMPLQADRLLQIRLLGRDQEFIALQGALKQNGVVAITGVAGIGKTFLLEALRHSSELRFATGKAIFEDSTPFGMISRIITELAQLQLLQNAPIEQCGWWQKLAPRADLGSVVLPPVSSDVALGKLQLLEAFRSLVLHVSDKIGLIFEDVQWADAASLELLRYALPLVPNAKVIVSYRSDEMTGQKRVLPEISKTIELLPLANTVMQQLLEGWLGAPVEAALIEQLVVPAGGNPWFLVERLKSMLEAQLLMQRNGIFEWTRSVVALPNSIFELLSQRIQHLSSHALEFAQAASIFGNLFLYTDVLALLEWHDDDCLDALEVLLRAKFVEESKKTDVFVFTHPIFAEGLQRKIISMKLRRWHRKAASLREARAANPIELAKHFLIGGVPEKAFDYAITGAEGFAAQYAYPQAETAYRIAWEAFELIEHTQILEGRLRHGTAHTQYALGLVSEALNHWQQALKIPNLQLEPSIRLSLAAALSVQGKGQDALQMLEPLQSPEALLEKANCYQRLKENSLAQACGVTAFRIYQKLQDPAGQARALSILAWVMHNQQFFKRGLALATRAEKLALQHPYMRLLAYRALIANQFDLSDFAAAEKTYQAALDLPATRAEIQHQAWFLLGLANLELMQDRFSEAQTHYLQALQSSQRAEADILQRQSSFSLVLIAHMQNQIGVALEAVTQIEDRAVAQLWQTRLELATGQQIKAPPSTDQLPTWTHSLQRITYLEWLLSTKQYQATLIHTETPDEEYQWFWCLARVHALWRSQKDTSKALSSLNQPMSDAGLSKDLIQLWNTIVSQIILRPESISRAQLEQFQHSAIGVFARDALLGLNSIGDVR